MSLLKIRDLKIRFDLIDGEVKAVNGLNLDLQEGQSLGVVGESGSGKTQFILSILGLLAKNARLGGSIKFKGEELIGLSQKKYQRIRGNEIAMIFQDPMTSLNPYLTVERQMTEVLETHENLSRKEAQARSIEALEMVEIPEARKRLFAYPHEMSGGMRQRVMIAMALLCRPSVLLADEPTTALDVTVQAQILSLLDKLRRDTGVSLIFITHNLGVVAAACDHVAVMYGGRFMEKGPVDAIFNQPQHPYTKALLRSMPRLHLKQERLTSIPGSPPNLQRLPKGCTFAPRCSEVMSKCYYAVPKLLPYPLNIRCACFAAEKNANKEINL